MGRPKKVFTMEQIENAKKMTYKEAMKYLNCSSSKAYNIAREHGFAFAYESTTPITNDTIISPKISEPVITAVVTDKLISELAEKAARTVFKGNNAAFSLEDMIQEGVVGCLKAVEAYPNRPQDETEKLMYQCAYNQIHTFITGSKRFNRHIVELRERFPGFGTSAREFKDLDSDEFNTGIDFGSECELETSVA